MALARHRPMERAQAPQQTAHGPGGVLAFTALATAIALMDHNAPMLTLHGMTADFHTPVSEQAWLLNGTPLGLVALLLVAGSLADDYGRRLAFLIGTAAKSLATGLGALATSTLTFTLSRVALGAACALIISSSLGLIAHAYPAGHVRVRAPGNMGRVVQRRHRHRSADRRRVRRSRLAPGLPGLRRRRSAGGRRGRARPP